MNPNRFKADMEMAWELRAETDLTPGSYAHRNRFVPAAKKNEENKSDPPKTEANKG